MKFDEAQVNEVFIERAIKCFNCLGKRFDESICTIMVEQIFMDCPQELMIVFKRTFINSFAYAFTSGANSVSDECEKNVMYKLNEYWIE